MGALPALRDRTELRAPFDGTVAEINGELGEVVTPSPIGVATLPAVDLMDISCLYVSAPIDEVDAREADPIHFGGGARQLVVSGLRDQMPDPDQGQHCR